MRRLLSFVAVASSSVLLGCSTSNSEFARASSYSIVACGSDAGAPCSAPPPSFMAEVVPILEAKCNNCHSGDSGLWPLTGHYNVSAWHDLIFLDLVQCTMPPVDAGRALSNGERATLLAWLACGAPDN